jgi:undecaprenyl-diphosphatase
MSWIQGLIIGLIQGLTEFLPISSKTHILFAEKIFHLGDTDKYLTFTIILHGATVLSTLFVFRKEIIKILKGAIAVNSKQGTVNSLKDNEDFNYVMKLLVSMIPVGILGLFFKKEIESLFKGDLTFIGIMMILTSILLVIGHLSRSGEKEITYKRSLWIGVAQALAVLPGISRSGTTISTGLALGVKRDKLAMFSFLMVIIPVLGEVFLDVIKGGLANQAHVSSSTLIISFLAAFISGVLACRWMVNLVKKGKLLYFAIYCFIVAIICLTI